MPDPTPDRRFGAVPPIGKPASPPVNPASPQQSAAGGKPVAAGATTKPGSFAEPPPPLSSKAQKPSAPAPATSHRGTANSAPLSAPQHVAKAPNALPALPAKWMSYAAAIICAAFFLGFVLKHNAADPVKQPETNAMRIQAEHNIAAVLQTEDRLLTARSAEKEGVTADDCQQVMSELAQVSSSPCTPETQAAFRDYKNSWNELQRAINALDNWVKDHKSGATFTEALLRALNGTIIGMGADLIHEHSTLVSNIRTAESAVRAAENRVNATFTN